MAEQRDPCRDCERQRAAAVRGTAPRATKALAAAVPVSQAILGRAAVAPQARSAGRAAPQVGVLIKGRDRRAVADAGERELAGLTEYLRLLRPGAVILAAQQLGADVR